MCFASDHCHLVLIRAHTVSPYFATPHTHTHTHSCLTALCQGLPRWAGTRKVKPTWILLKQETVSGSGISWAICKSAPRSRQDNHASIPPLNFFTDRMPFLPPNQQCQQLKEHCHTTVVILSMPNLFRFKGNKTRIPVYVLLLSIVCTKVEKVAWKLLINVIC